MKRSFDPVETAKPSRPIAYPFVLDQLNQLDRAGKLALSTRAMFGSTALYDGDHVLFILREKGDADDGVWVAYDEAREAEALSALPNLVKIARLPNVRCWRMLAASSDTFEEDVLAACQVVLRADRPIGKIPVRAKAKTASTKKPLTLEAKKKASATKKPTPKKKTPRETTTRETTTRKTTTREKSPPRGSR